MVRIQVLEPASDPLTPFADDLVLLNSMVVTEKLPGENEKRDDSLEIEFFNLASREAIVSLAGILNESPGFNYLAGSRILEIPFGVEEGTILDRELVISLCDSLGADVLVSLDHFISDYDHSVNVRHGTYETGWSNYYEGRLDLHISAIWRAYEGETGAPVDEYVLNDTMQWVGAAFTRRELDAYLPRNEEALMEAAYFVAINYARRIAPYWMEDERSYFSRGHRRIRLASEYIENHDLDEAATIYGRLTSHRNSNIVAAALHNLALVYEMKGEYLNALKLARESFSTRMHPVTDDYLDILEERLEKADKLDRQLDRSH